MPRRTGATLIEVLVAIFVMGIGMMALLTLFPLGALSMAKAIRDDRAAQVGINATGTAALRNIRSDPGDTAFSWPSLASIMKNPTNYFGLAAGSLPDADPEKKSYPVLVDPVGYQSSVAPFHRRAAGSLWLPRYQPTFVATSTQPVARTFQWFTLLDDLAFDSEENSNNVGNPKNLLPGVVERYSRYSWAYLVQQPRTADTAVVNLSVIVFDGRPLGLTGNLTPSETLYEGFSSPISEVAFDASSNVIRVRWEFFNSLIPQVRAGDWVLDASRVQKESHGYFYRVGGITEGSEEIPSGSGKFYQYLDVEVQQPLRGFTGTFASSANPVADPNRARLIVMEGVAEVFERGVGKGAY
jgi:hypothetical protein